MLFSTSDSNSSLNTGTVFGYVPDKPEHMTSAGSMMIGIPNSSTTSITQLLGSSLNASINYIPINFGGSSSKEFSQVNVSVDAHTFKNESKILLFYVSWMRISRGISNALNGLSDGFHEGFIKSFDYFHLL